MCHEFVLSETLGDLLVGERQLKESKYSLLFGVLLKYFKRKGGTDHDPLFDERRVVGHCISFVALFEDLKHCDPVGPLHIVLTKNEVCVV